jgi:hypothetical protein
VIRAFGAHCQQRTCATLRIGLVGPNPMSPLLLDQLIGLGNQRLPHAESERFCGLEIND